LNQKNLRKKRKGLRDESRFDRRFLRLSAFRGIAR
jgi:hypothetical protein